MTIFKDPKIYSSKEKAKEEKLRTPLPPPPEIELLLLHELTQEKLHIEPLTIVEVRDAILPRHDWLPRCFNTTLIPRELMMSLPAQLILERNQQFQHQTPSEP